MTLTSPRREPLADQVIAQLRAQITSGEWPVGSRIPTEVELVEQLGVARNTVREAVRALAHNGLLDIRQGSGTYVLATSELAGVMHRRFAGAPWEQVTELRGALEAAAARLAASRRTARDLKLLDTALARREDAWRSGDVEHFIQTDTAFHQAVIAAAHNDVLSALYADLGEVMRSELRQTVGPVLAEHRYVAHDGILAGIREGDGEKASQQAVAVLTTCRA
ncbi:FadR family transcriptional regulator [Streptacidiphilus sp. PB12-B1b]|uniref:FadR/GntR family transcriptional regulator n=1 Tax=Streptacidiphilus sp. PB12-B1b TaxID=2705012 RepID=UPI0015FDFF73|nr:FCD domain-containing protein [Streptacidiphilus sp. PB12-B1b]QMU78507.1 FadR family transcriptional regulator [Streptacidiphilus sp. PB12-B1b]